MKAELSIRELEEKNGINSGMKKTNTINMKSSYE